MSRHTAVHLLLAIVLVVPFAYPQTSLNATLPAINGVQRPATPRPGRNSGGRPIHNEAERVARWKPIPIPYNRTGLNPREQQMIQKLVDACNLMDQLYWHQSDLGGYAVYHATQNADLLHLFSINGSRWDLVDRNSPFLGEEPLVPGHEI